MTIDREFSRDESGDPLGQMIRAAMAQPSPPEVRNRVIETAAALNGSSPALLRRTRRRSWLLVASVTAAVSAASVLGILLLPSATVGWEDVTKAVTSQPWIRATLTRNGKQDTFWLSPERQIWAFRAGNNWCIFLDGRQRARYEYREGGKQIEKTPVGEEDAQLISPIDYLSQGLWAFGTEKVLSQERREVTEGGRKWIEFDLVFARGEMKAGMLRVNPETRLPVYLQFRSPTDTTKSLQYDFDYPTSGPSDVYALGVPAGTRIDDRMPSNEVFRVLDGIAAGRAQIGNFRLVVAASPTNPSLIVWRKGDRWRIDLCVPERWPDLNHRDARPPDGQGWGDPIAEQLKLCWLGPLYICDGRTVYENANPVELLQKRQPGTQGAKPIVWQPAPYTAPQDLLSGKGLGHLNGAPHVKIASLVYPDLSPIPGWGFEFDPKPADAPGCVLIKRSARLAMAEPTVGHEWYYIDPAQGYVLVRAEFFSLPADAPADPKAAPARRTIRLEGFQQSPQGFSYPKVIHDTLPPMLALNQKGEPRTLYSTCTVHYHFDFDAALPDSLFVVEAATK